MASPLAATPPGRTSVANAVRLAANRCELRTEDGAPDVKAMGTQIVGKFCLQERYEGCLANAHKRFVVTCRSNLDHTRMDLPARGPLGSGQALIQGLPPR